VDIQLEDAKNLQSHKYSVWTKYIFRTQGEWQPNILCDGGTKVVLCIGSLYACVIIINKNNTKWLRLKEFNSAAFEVNWFGELFTHI
jgi:hypothetical protein